MFPVLPLIENCNTGEDNEDLLNAGRRRWPGYIMSALAKRAVRTGRTVGVDVSKLCRGANEEEDCEERNEQNAGRCVRCSHFASPQHRYLSIYLNNSESPTLPRAEFHMRCCIDEHGQKVVRTMH